jgi:dihydrofolate reductase
MTVIATITTSLDGYVTGPDDGPGNGLGTGGERLHNWVMGGPWTYESEREPGAAMGPVDREFFDVVTANLGAGVCGRGMYEAAGHWGGTNPFGGPLFVLTHRLDDAPDPATGFRFVEGIDEAVAAAREAAGPGKDVGISGGADTIRQALAAGHVDELILSVAPLVLGRGKALFDGFDHDLELEPVKVWSSPLATHLHHRIVRTNR